MEYLEKTQGWKEEEFDIVLQFMRTVLLKREQRAARLTLLLPITNVIALQTVHR